VLPVPLTVLGYFTGLFQGKRDNNRHAVAPK
jgi:hypothetical protein